MEKEREKDKDYGILNINKVLYKTRLSKKFMSRKLYEPADPRLIMSFIPGTILDILVKEGQKVKTGDELLILDSMKMKNRLKSGRDGIIESIEVKPGVKVAKGTLLLKMK